LEKIFDFRLILSFSQKYYAMKSLYSFLVLVILLLVLSFTGCKNPPRWKKNDQKTQRNSIMMKNEDVMAFNDFRTIDASMMEPSKKPRKSLLWENSQTQEIERHLGVVQD